MEFCKRGVAEKFCWEILKGFINWLDIADLFSFLISFALKKEEQESSLDFVHEQRRIIFSLSRGLKFVFMSFRVTFDSGDNTSSCYLGKCECVLSSCDWV
jgi:hypothetical protein